DSVNPQTASTKAERMIERDKVACIIGEISSASCLTIAQVAQRTKTLFINTGGNSDALRGSDCKRYMFHVESQNSMYVKTVGRSFLRDGLVKGKKWYSLTADYAFGHDLLKVSKRFMEANGGNFAGDDLVPTDATDFIEHFESGAKYDLLKSRPGYFRASDHQLMHEMYAVTALPVDKIKNQWDIFSSSPAVPGPDEPLEAIAATKEENSCTFPS